MPSIKHIHQSLADFFSISTIKDAPSCNNVAPHCRWNPNPPPPPRRQGWIKLNTDTTTTKNSNAIATISRDYRGEV